jgi:flagellar hook-basal body complex protein FliE
MIDPVSALDALPTQATASMSAVQQPSTDFSSWLSQQVSDVNTKIGEADMQVRQLAVGENTNIHQVMISLEKARLSLELVVQVRNKVLEAYQNMMQMQI